MNAQLTRSSDVAGGQAVESEFIKVTFQSGYAAQVGVNGCRPQEVIKVAIERLLAFQDGPLACKENEEALFHLQAANAILDERIRLRSEQGVLNTGKAHSATRTEDEVEEFSATGA